MFYLHHCHLRATRTVPFLTKALEDAGSDGYVLGVKLVRGAYHPFELRGCQQQFDVALDPSDLPPVHEQKEATDDAYNKCVKMLIESIARGGAKGKPIVGVLFGTHNWTSAKLILKTLVDNGLATAAKVPSMDGDLKINVREDVVAQVIIAQLYGTVLVSSKIFHTISRSFPGMCEGLTQYLVDHIESQTPMIIK